MTDEDAKGIGKPVGDAIIIFIAVVHALRKQPHFDNAMFRAELEPLLQRGDLSDVQRELLLTLLKEHLVLPPENP